MEASFSRPYDFGDGYSSVMQALASVLDITAGNGLDQKSK